MADDTRKTTGMRAAPYGLGLPPQVDPSAPPDIPGVIPDIPPQTQSDYVPDIVAGAVSDAQTPTLAPQPKPSVGTKILDTISALAPALQSSGNAIEEAAGAPWQAELAQKRSEFGPKLAAETGLKKAQMEENALYRQGMLQNARDKANLQYGPDSIAAQRATIASDLAQARIPNIQTDTAKKAFELETLKNGQFPVDPVTAQLVNRPDLSNKPVSAQLWKGFNDVLTARGLKAIDLGQDGYWLVDRGGNRVHQISSVSPSMARGQAYQMNRPVMALDPTDNTVKWMPAGQAEALGAAPAVQGGQILSKQAQFKDIYAGIASMRQAVNGLGAEPLDPTTIGKLTLAMRETDPTVFKSELDTILGSQQLTPAQQDFVVAVGQLNERALSLRNLAGMGHSSDQLRSAIRATLPSAKSGTPELMRKQLDAVTNLVDNLYTGVPNVRTSAVPRSAQPAKIASRAHVQDYARQKGITEAQAEQEFKSAGYTIGQ